MVVNRIDRMVKVVKEIALIIQTSNFPSYLFALQLAIDMWGGFFISVSVSLSAFVEPQISES